MASSKNIQNWVKTYKEFGKDGLTRSKKNRDYTFDFKFYVVELYLTREFSYQSLALKVGINYPTLITRWVNDYRIAGPDALMPKRKGRKSKMTKINDKKKVNSQDVSNDYLKKLEDENLKLRIENAYLKELRRLNQEEKPLSKNRE